MEDIYTIEIDDKEYFIIDEIVEGDKRLVYLSNTLDPKDFLIRKVSKEDDKEVLIGLDSKEEFDRALEVFLNRHKDEI